MKKHNFFAGPAILPAPVLKQAAEAVTDFGGMGLSILEISHRSKPFVAVLDEAEALVRELLGVSDEFAVLFLTGGASSEFYLTAMNLLNEDETAGYVDTGAWSATPPVYPIYVSMLTLRWIKENGGVEAMEKKNEAKAKLLYDEIDRNPKFRASVAPGTGRSLMNVCFLPTNPDDLEPFVKAATEAGCVGITGHRSVGGFRASIYNSMPIESVQVLVDVMKKF